MRIDGNSQVYATRTTAVNNNHGKQADANKASEANITQSQGREERLPVKSVTYEHPQRRSAKNSLGAEEIRQLQVEADRAHASLRELVREMLRQQGIRFRDGVDLGGESLDPANESADAIAPGTKIEQHDYWGVQATADRIVNFAKALAGDDPSKAASLRGAVIQGFAEAERIFGGALPQISHDTYAEIMRQFDEWENEAA